MRANNFLLLLLFCLTGCHSQTPQTQTIPPNAPKTILSDCRRENDSAFSQKERQIISAARSYLEKSDHQKIDAYYRVAHTADGYEVYVEFVNGYSKEQPILIPGMFCVVYLHEDGSVIRVVGGA